MLYIKSEMQDKKETLDHVNFLKRNSLFYDSQITYDDVDVTYALRVGDIALCLTGSMVELFKFDGTGYPIKQDRPFPVPGADQVVLDPTHALYIKSQTAIHKIVLSTTFANIDFDRYTINCRPSVISARGGMLAYLGSDEDEETLHLKKYCPDGNNTSNAVFSLGIKGHCQSHYANDPEPKVKNKKGGIKNTLCLKGSNMAIAGSGVIVATKFKFIGKHKAVLLYYRLMSNHKAVLADSKDITPRDESVYKHNMKKRCTVFEQRGMPACLLWHPKDPTSYALFVFKNGRFMTMVDWGKDQTFLKYLKGNYTMSVPRSEYDHLTNKILICTTKHFNEKNKHAVFARVRFTF